jgi:HSP20 family protein
MAETKTTEPKETAPEEKPSAVTPAEGFFGLPNLFASMESMRDQMDRLFHSFTNGWPALGGETALREQSTGLGLGHMPKVETSEDDKQFEISVELPGVDEKDVSVSVDRGVLSIKGEKKAEREEKKKDFHLTERSYGSFERSFHLPEAADQQKISADFDNGVLKVVVPKSATNKPSERKIAISTKK